MAILKKIIDSTKGLAYAGPNIFLKMLSKRKKSPLYNKGDDMFEKKTTYYF